MLLHFVIFCFAKCWNYEYSPPPPKWIIENPFTFDSYKGGMCISLEIVCIFSCCMQTAFRSPTFWQIDFVSVPTCYANDTHIKNDLHKFHSIWIETIICNRIRNLYRNTSAQISFSTLNYFNYWCHTEMFRIHWACSTVGLPFSRLYKILWDFTNLYPLRLNRS